MTDCPVNGKDPGNPQCGAEFPCHGDPDDACFCGPVGPERRRFPVRYSARATEQIRQLSGDRRWPLHSVHTGPHDHDCSLHDCWRSEP